LDQAFATELGLGFGPQVLELAKQGPGQALAQGGPAAAGPLQVFDRIEGGRRRN
jgi:hypothetical protein